MKETDLGPPVSAWFRDLGWETGWDVYQEVSLPSGCCDMVVRHGTIIGAVELKLRLGFDVLEQGARHRPFVHYTWVAVPGRPLHAASLQAKVADMLGLGVLCVRERVAGSSDDYGVNARLVTESVEPKLTRRIEQPDIAKYLHEEQKTFSPAGSSGAPRWTPWKAMCKEIRAAVAQNPGITLKELVVAAKHRYRTPKAARVAFYSWLHKDIVPGVHARKDEGGTLRVWPRADA